MTAPKPPSDARAVLEVILAAGAAPPTPRTLRQLAQLCGLVLVELDRERRRADRLAGELADLRARLDDPDRFDQDVAARMARRKGGPHVAVA